MNSQQRTLAIFLRLLNGNEISKQTLMNDFASSASTIQRAISSIEEALEFVFHQQYITDFLTIEGNKGTYQLKHLEGLGHRDKLTDEEIFFLIKLVFGSRVLNEHEMTQIYDKLLFISTNDKHLKTFFGSEKVNYQGVAQVNLFEWVRVIGEAIEEKSLIEFEYSKNGHTEVLQRVPQAIHYSDMYLYMMSDNHRSIDNATLADMNKFRINNMKHIKKIPTSHRKHYEYTQRYEGGVLHNQTGKYSYFGKPITMVVEFYFDPVYILDRFPDSRIISEEDGVYTIEMQVNDGYGIKMWLLSEGDMIKVLSPASMREYTVNEMVGALELYGYQVYKGKERVYLKDLDH